MNTIKSVTPEPSMPPAVIIRKLFQKRWLIAACLVTGWAVGTR